ncbi:MAG: acyltransferase [Elusimicrobia bacterium]|nr:acyltransferase [Elusimicrobiota bacterium]
MAPFAGFVDRDEDQVEKGETHVRNIPWPQRIAAFVLMGIWMGVAGGIARLLVPRLPGAGPFLYFFAFATAWVIVGLGIHRALMGFFPLREGDVPPGSRQEFIYHVFYLPFLFCLFYPLAFSGMIPIPLTRLFFSLFGARLGRNTYPGAGMIFDPRFVTVGDHVIMGYQSSLIPHAIEGANRVSHSPIRIGDNAVIGVNAVILGGVTVGEGAVIAAGAVVPKSTVIPPREIWGGLPARRMGQVE